MVDPGVIQKSKHYALDLGTSLSCLVEDLLKKITEKKEK
jgi:hypothetical protein